MGARTGGDVGLLLLQPCNLVLWVCHFFFSLGGERERKRGEKISQTNLVYKGARIFPTPRWTSSWHLKRHWVKHLRVATPRSCHKSRLTTKAFWHLITQVEEKTRSASDVQISARGNAALFRLKTRGPSAFGLTRGAPHPKSSKKSSGFVPRLSGRPSEALDLPFSRGEN